jgi:hypothetical protein
MVGAHRSGRLPILQRLFVVLAAAALALLLALPVLAGNDFVQQLSSLLDSTVR